MNQTRSKAFAQLVIVLTLCLCHPVFSQQRVTIADSVTLKILDQFIDQPHMSNLANKMIRINLRSYQKQDSITSETPTHVGSIEGRKLTLSTNTTYTYRLSLEVNSQVTEWYPVT